jgi:hypothetical protein
MQALRAFVTLLPMMACATAPLSDANWTQIAFAAGDKTEAQSGIDQLSKTEPLTAYRLAMRMGLHSSAAGPKVALALELSEASADRAESLGKNNPELRRAAIYRLLQLKKPAAAARIAQHSSMQGLIAQVAGQEDKAKQALLSAAVEPLPPLWALRATRRAQDLAKPDPSPEALSAWQALSGLSAPGEAIKRAALAPKADCLAAVVAGLAHEEIGRPVASAEAFGTSDCLQAKIHQARVMARLKPAAARQALLELSQQAPLNRSLLSALRRLHPAASAEGQQALTRQVAWHPEDHYALRERLTELERDKEWAQAHRLCERSLHMNYSDDLHLLSLRYLALSGAKARSNIGHNLLVHRLEWLRKRRKDLAQLTELDALLAGAEEEGGALGAARMRLKPRVKYAPKPDAAAKPDESPR